MSSFRLSVRYVMLVLTTAAGAVILAGCASRPDVSWNYKASVPLTNLRYYNWYPGEKSRHGDSDSYDVKPLTQDRIESAVNMVLHSQGYREVDTRRFNSRNISTDFYVYASYTIAPQIQGFQNLNHYYYPSTTSLNSAPAGNSVRSYEEEILTIDIIDPDSKQVVWSGKSWARINKFATQQQRVTSITNAVQEILSGFPRLHHSRQVQYSP